MSAESFKPIIAAVAADGFSPKLLERGLRLEGRIAVGNLTVPLAIEFADLSLVECPRVFVPDISMLNRKVVPHLDDEGELCVVNRRFHVFDRHRAPEQTRGLIVQAGEVLARGMTKAGTQEIAAEFGSYWSNRFIDLSENDSGDKADPPVTSRNLAYLSTAATLSFETHQAKPQTLGELVEWAAHWDASLRTKILAAFGRLTPNDPTIVIQAANGNAAATLQISAKGTAFAKSLKREAAWKRFIAGSAALALPIERIEGRRTDLAKILGANGPQGEAPLAQRHVVLIGCGAIGGYLSRMLAQLGAGLPGGRLSLLDPDRLDLSNIRRHALGAGDVARNKPEACAELIGRDFPGTAVFAVTGDAQRHDTLLASADLIIDATGEQGVSEWLNTWGLARRANSQPVPAILYVWIAGNGAAAQSFLSIDDVHACYRCLQPDLKVRGRFDPLREAPLEPVAPCGEQPFTPYGPAAPAMAAGLASQHASDWALGHPHHLLRTLRIDWEATVKRDPKSPDKAQDCPACRQS